MNTQINSVSTFLQATNAIMQAATIWQIPVKIEGDVLNYGRIGTRMSQPEKILYLGSRVPIEEFIDFLPVVEKPSAEDLDLNARNGRRDFVSQWWSMQGFVNDSLKRMELLEKPKQRALEQRRHAEEAERLAGSADAAWPFLESASILATLSVENRTVAGEIFGAARNFEAAKLHASSAIAYELAFAADRSAEYANKAAAQWLESLRQEPDAETMRFRANRGLIFAGQKPYSRPYRELLRESGRLHSATGRCFVAGADYMRAAWSMIQCGTPSKSGWSDISSFMASAAQMFATREDDVFSQRVGELAEIAAGFAQQP